MPQARRRFDGAVVGLIDPGDQLQQARFAGAVAARPNRLRSSSAAARRTARSRMRWPPRAQRDAIDGEHGRGPYSAAAARAQTKCLSADPPRFPPLLTLPTRKPARLRQKNKIKRDAFTPRPRANDQQRGRSMKPHRALSSPVWCCFRSFACADQQSSCCMVRQRASRIIAPPQVKRSIRMGEPQRANLCPSARVCVARQSKDRQDGRAVRVNDRGPFVSGLTLDLVLWAARAIGMRSTASA